MEYKSRSVENPATGEIISMDVRIDSSGEEIDKYTDQELLKIAIDEDLFSIIHNKGLDDPPEQKPTWVDQFTDVAKENLDIPGGLVGAAVGARGGVPGMIMGGAAGTFAGSIGSDYLTKEDISYANALEEAGWSVGIDVATLMTGKAYTRILRPLIESGWLATQRALGKTPKESLEELLRKTGEGTAEAGTKASLLASQRMLGEEGLSLVPSNVSEKNNLIQSIAELGILSSGVMSKNADNINKFVQQNITDIVNRGFVLGDPSQLGETVYDLLDAGRKALSENYETMMKDVVLPKLGKHSMTGNYINMSGIKAKIDYAIQNSMIPGVKDLSDLDDATLSYLKQLRESLAETKVLTPEALFAVEKKITAQVNKLGERGSAQFNDAAARELFQFSSTIKDEFNKALAKVDPDAAAEYLKVKKAYAKGMQGILPELNASFVRRAKKEDFSALGNMVSGNGSIDQVRKMFSSIDRAYATMSKEARAELPYKTAKEAKQAIRGQYLKNIFDDLHKITFDAKAHSKTVENLLMKGGDRKAKTILGEEYARARQVFNLIQESTRKDGSTIGTLFVKAKEFGAITDITAGVAAFGGLMGAGAGPTAAGIGGAVGILTAPVFLAAVARSPKYVNKLVMLDNKKFSKPALAATAVANFITDVMLTMSEEEQAEVKNIERGVAQ